MAITIEVSPVQTKRFTARLHTPDGKFVGRAKLVCHLYRVGHDNAPWWDGSFQVLGKFNPNDFAGKFEYRIERPNKEAVNIHAYDIITSRAAGYPVTVTGHFGSREKPPRSIFA